MLSLNQIYSSSWEFLAHEKRDAECGARRLFATQSARAVCSLTKSPSAPASSYNHEDNK